jgi:two-component system, OmpR family, KDP operon response regulator KdpE
MVTNKSVLVVHDQPCFLKAIDALLKANGYESLTTTSGAEAINIVRQQKPDMVLLDILMPDITGLDVLDSVRTFSKVPIFVLSEDRSVIEMATKLGANGAIPKPFNPVRLIKTIKMFLEENTAVPV